MINYLKKTISFLQDKQLKTKQLQQLFSENLGNIYSNTEINKLFEIFSKEYLNYSRIDILINKYNELDEKETSKFKLALEKLISGKPYQQILGKTYFYGNKFLVNENVLIPRPETEELIELALNKIQKTDKKQLKILDIGTGSGCIAITLAKYLKNAIVYAVDISREAIDIAKKNAETHNTEINFILMDYLFEDITKISDTYFDIIISNPPYISTQEESFIEKQVKGFEPKMALFAPKEDPYI